MNSLNHCVLGAVLLIGQLVRRGATVRDLTAAHRCGVIEDNVSNGQCCRGEISCSLDAHDYSEKLTRQADKIHRAITKEDVEQSGTPVESPLTFPFTPSDIDHDERCSCTAR